MFLYFCAGQIVILNMVAGLRFHFQASSTGLLARSRSESAGLGAWTGATRLPAASSSGDSTGLTSVGEFLAGRSPVPQLERAGLSFRSTGCAAQKPVAVFTQLAEQAEAGSQSACSGSSAMSWISGLGAIEKQSSELAEQAEAGLWSACSGSLPMPVILSLGAVKE